MKLPFNIDLNNKTAVVTGGGGVLCSMFAKALAKSGAKVAILDLRLDAATKVAEEIVKETDPKAFLIISSAAEIYGEGYKNIYSEKI